MDGHKIITKSGEIEICEVGLCLLKEIQNILPYGFVPLKETFNGYRYGFVVKCDSEELKCLKQQPVEVEEKVANKMIHFHHLLILDTYVQIMEQIGDSLYYATPYLKNKGDKGYETGIVHFLFPKRVEHITKNCSYEKIFGDGATDLFMTFIKKFQEINKASGLDIPYIGFDVRTRAQIGSLISGFMIYKGNVIYHGAKIVEGDPRFELLANRGIKKVIHMPSAPMEIRKGQFAEAKGLNDSEL